MWDFEHGERGRRVRHFLHAAVGCARALKPEPPISASFPLPPTRKSPVCWSCPALPLPRAARAFHPAGQPRAGRKDSHRGSGHVFHDLGRPDENSVRKMAGRRQDIHLHGAEHRKNARPARCRISDRRSRASDRSLALPHPRPRRRMDSLYRQALRLRFLGSSQKLQEMHYGRRMRGTAAPAVRVAKRRSCPRRIWPRFSSNPATTDSNPQASITSPANGLHASESAKPTSTPTSPKIFTTSSMRPALRACNFSIVTPPRSERCPPRRRCVPSSAPRRPQLVHSFTHSVPSL